MAAAPAAAPTVCPGPALRQQLREQGLDSPQVLRWLRDEDVETREDLVATFRSAPKVLEVAPCMAEAWAWAVRTGDSPFLANEEARQLLRRLREASRAVVRPIAEAIARTRRLRAKRPRPKAKARPEKDIDQEGREAAAREAVRRSLLWRPQTGVARGLLADDPLLGPIRAIYERRIAKFEARGVWAALKVLDSWTAYRQEYMGSGSELETVVALTNFVEEQQAATGPLSTWNKLDWVRRHLKIEFPLHEVPKPSRKAAEDTGVVAEVEQAVSIPPEYLVAFEECLRRMVIADDWRRVALAAGLEVAYSLVRVIHMNRSGFLTQSKLVCWLEAFRGKGKRQGARKPFKRAMVRHGITGLDIADVIFQAWDAWSRHRRLPLTARGDPEPLALKLPAASGATGSAARRRPAASGATGSETAATASGFRSDWL